MTITRSPFAHFCHIPKPARQTRPGCLRTRMLSRQPILTPLVPQATQMSADTHVVSWQPKGPTSCPIKPQTSPAVWIPLCKIPFCPDVHYLFMGAHTGAGYLQPVKKYTPLSLQPPRLALQRKYLWGFGSCLGIPGTRHARLIWYAIARLPRLYRVFGQVPATSCNDPI